MKNLVFVLICACLCVAAVRRPVIPIPGGDPRRTNSVPVNRLRVFWGNYTWPDSPTKPPVLQEIDFTGFGGGFVDRRVKTVTTRARNYEFAARANARQVMWIPDALGPPTFSVNGFPWQLYPSANTASQSLVITGIPGKVYITSEQNSGGQSLANNDPIVIQ